MTNSSRVAVSIFLGLAWFCAARAMAADDVERGAYLVGAFGCADCHAPLKRGPDGPKTDLSRGLSGHPQGMTLPPPPAPQGPWLRGGSATNTAFWGPWGINYAVNLTPDKQTGIGAWIADDFVKAMKTGKHLGVGRPILPQMPWPGLSRMTEADLQAMFAYLMVQPAVSNAVPEPVVASRP